MNYVYYTDEKNNKLIPQWVAVATESGLKKYEAAHPHREDVKDAIGVIRSLPVSNYNSNATEKPTISVFPKNLKNFNYGDDFYSVLNTARPSVYLHLRDLKVTEKDVERGLPSAEFIAAVTLLLSLDKNGIGSELTNWKKLRKGVDDGSYTLNEFSPIDAFTTSSSYALFWRNEHGSEGYLTENGFGPLSRAITYDSLEEMEAAFNRQARFANYEHLQIVKIKSEVEGLGELKKMPHSSSHSWVGKTELSGASIYQVANDVQRKNIERALQQASEQQIIDAYNALNNSSENGVQKRRM